MSYYVYKKGEMDLYVHFISPLVCCISFMHLADTFIQSDLQCIQALHFLVSMCVPWELNPQPFALLTPLSHRNITTFDITSQTKVMKKLML